MSIFDFWWVLSTFGVLRGACLAGGLDLEAKDGDNGDGEARRWPLSIVLYCSLGFLIVDCVGVIMVHASRAFNF